ncbi:MAG: alpha/beta fold hydrolase [Saprospiraceae bacterium]|nr:alpha/beta fold hydrolase [Saprospiraceae bacterium]
MKATLVLLHGALESSGQFNKLITLLEPHFYLECLDFVGHGQNKAVDRFTIGELSIQLKQYLKSLNINKMNILGYSMGGYVALHALPEISPMVNSIITLATKLSWHDEFIEEELLKLNPETIEAKVPKLIVKLEQDHPNSAWKAIIQATNYMMQTIQNYPLDSMALGSSNSNIFIVRGADDKMVTQEESRSFAAGLNNAKYIELDATPHFFHKMDPQLIAKTVLNILTND